VPLRNGWRNGGVVARKDSLVDVIPDQSSHATTALSYNSCCRDAGHRFQPPSLKRGPPFLLLQQQRRRLSSMPVIERRYGTYAGGPTLRGPYLRSFLCRTTVPTVLQNCPECATLRQSCSKLSANQCHERVSSAFVVATRLLFDEGCFQVGQEDSFCAS